MSDLPSEVDLELEALAQRLEATGGYRVLRAVPRPPRLGALPPGAREGVYLDLETTGLDPGSDAIIELGLVRFAYDEDGPIGMVDDLSAFEDPGRPIPPEIQALTGITDAMVSGRQLPEDRVRELFDGAHLVVAHNAAFDRPFAERRFPFLSEFPWACSCRGVPWKDLGRFDGVSLGALVTAHGHFFDGHRAVEDCYAGVHLLGRRFADGSSVLSHLRSGARRTDVRIWAVRSPFESKDLLRARGYRWNAEARVWWRDVPAEELDAEKAFLSEHVYGGRMPELPERVLDAWTRFSRRLGEAPV